MTGAGFLKKGKVPAPTQGFFSSTGVQYWTITGVVFGQLHRNLDKPEIVVDLKEALSESIQFCNNVERSMAFNGVQWSDGGLAEQWPVANHESFRHRQWVLDLELGDLELRPRAWTSKTSPTERCSYRLRARSTSEIQ